MPGRRQANLRLRALLQQSAMTQEALARAVNTIGHERGLRLFYDRTSVAHWLRGARPRPPVPELITEAFARRLGRPITVATTGLTASDDARRTAPDTVDPAERLTRLSTWDAAPGYGENPSHTPYSTSTVPVTPIRETGPTTTRPMRPGAHRPETESARTVLTCFSTLDSTYGGGHARGALAQYLAFDIADRLKATADTPAWGELCGVTIRLTALCGTMSFDTQLHFLAQEYYRTALALAEQSTDADGTALVLHRISVHARFLGQGQEALRLAEAALKATPPGNSNTVRAQRTGQLAACLADLAEHRRAMSRLRRAEDLIDQEGDAVEKAENRAVGQAQVHWRRAEVLSALGVSQDAVAAMRLVMRLLPPAHRRARLLARARLGVLLLDAGETAQAAEVVSAFLDEAADVRSALVAAAHEGLLSRYTSFHHHAAGAAVWQRLLVNRPLWGGANPDRPWCCPC
ncbi:hypothetical protein ACH4FX_36310 [Streptomyces sp. NPDC018019]|uniref:hypothetical protein n=1 Tax=Streptomyces sp. NPDC018019 TaxID=3365030 RepID=UPI003789B36C